MRSTIPIVILASWLAISTFAFLQSGPSFLLAWAVALLAAGIALASPGHPGPRLLVSALALLLVVSSLLLPGVSLAARVSNGAVGGLIVALCFVPSPLRRVGGRSGA
jgi:hypothetical protein